MSRKIFIPANFLAIILLPTLLAPSAQADNTWISRPSLSTVSLVAPATTRTGNNTALSTQTSSVVLTYKGSLSDAGKFAQINLFDISPGLTITMTGSPRASASGCEQQVLAGDAHSCMFALDGAGNAGIVMTLSGVTLSSSFKYILLSGPNIVQTDPAVVTFSAPKSTIKPVAATVRGQLGGAAVAIYKITENSRVVTGMKVTLSFKGSGENPSATTLTTDSKGQVYFYLSNLTSKRTNTTVTATIQGTVINTTATIVWG